MKVVRLVNTLITRLYECIFGTNEISGAPRPNATSEQQRKLPKNRKQVRTTPILLTNKTRLDSVVLNLAIAA